MRLEDCSFAKGNCLARAVDHVAYLSAAARVEDAVVLLFQGDDGRTLTAVTVVVEPPTTGVATGGDHL